MEAEEHICIKVHCNLRGRGIHIQRNYIQDSLLRVDPRGIRQKFRISLHRIGSITCTVQTRCNLKKNSRATRVHSLMVFWLLTSNQRTLSDGLPAADFKSLNSNAEFLY